VVHVTVDLVAVTRRQQQVWSLGDYGRVGSLQSWIGEHLVRSVDVHAGERVLDVAAGNGNCSLPAARRFADVLATDYVPELLAETQTRADAEGVPLRTQVADAQALPFEDASFDVVLSSIGAMFAPDQDAVAAELLRVCRPGGRIGLANWTLEGGVGDMFRCIASFVPPPQGVLPAVAWGSEDRVRQLLGAGCAELRTERRTCSWRFPSSAALVEYFRTWYGPTIAAFSAVGDAGAAALTSALEAVFEAQNRAGDGTFAGELEYLEVVAVRG
jgi:ubiquinone/menaquinone biosynthesis C-methylase UbiE